MDTSLVTIVHKVKCSDNLIDKYNMEQGRVFYIGYENEPTRQGSILFENLDWLRKRFGDKNGRITNESLNVGRNNTIKELELCLEANVPRWELSKINEDGTIKTYIGDDKTEKSYKVYKLYDREQFEKDIARGRLILCKLV